jgi:uncharacterized membrane protein
MNHQDAIKADELHLTEDGFRRRYPWIWAGTLYGPFIATFLLLLVLWSLTNWQFASRLVTSTVLSIVALGRFIILSGSDGALLNFEGKLSSAQLFLLLTYVDAMTALVLAFHIGFLFRMPVVGPRIATLVTDGQFILTSHPWMRRAAMVGLIVFVSFPLSATGSVGGSIFGRLLGLTRLRTFFGILIGSIIGNGQMYFFSDLMNQWIDKDHPVFAYGGFLVIFLIVIMMEGRYRRLRKQFAAQHATEVNATEVGDQENNRLSGSSEPPEKSA